MTRELRFGVLGAGQISRAACPEISSHPRARVVAVSDPHPGRLAELAKAIGGVRATPDSASLLTDPELDAIYIATPNALHAPLALAALDAGKHVIVEKPFTTNLADAAAVVERAERVGRLVSVGMNQRFRPDSQRIASLTQSGGLGNVYHAKAFWHRRAGIPKLGSWFGSRALAGGGAVYDIGVHLLDLALFVLNRFEPRTVSAQVYSSFGARGVGEGGWGLSEREHPSFDVDDAATALLRYEDGLTISLDVSWARHQPEPDEMNVLLHGTAAGAGCYPGQLYRSPSTTDASAETPITSGLPETPLTYPHQSRFHNFIGAILGTETLCVSPAQALAVQRVLGAIYESSRLGREVMLSKP
jgi:predicted dehydrogenase